MSEPVLHREIGLWRGVALNMIDMVGIGPFITIPLILTAMGGGRGMLAWVLGGLLAISDGLVTAELASELPGSGGSYVFLRQAYGRYGRVISFLFLFQICFSAPLSMASGCIGFANYLKILVPAAGDHVKPVAMAICIVTTLLLLRRIGHIGKFSILLWIGVLGTLAIVIGAGLPHLKLSAFTFWNAPRLDHAAGYAGLGAALLYAVYDYLGYYNICYLGDEVQNPTKTIPRVIVISILAIGVIYLVMNACLVSVLILWTAFASIFSLMLGYSRILYAAARDRNFFSVFGRLHSTQAYPYVSLLFLGGVASVFCWIDLKFVLQAILSIRAIIPFVAQNVGSVILRQREPDRPRPFRMWLYPLPAFVALGLWGYIVGSPQKGLKVGGLYVIAAGLIFYFVREWLLKRSERAVAHQ